MSGGQVYIELNILHQIGKVIHPKKTSHLMDKAKTVMLMNSVNHILEAFKKARERMLLAREPVPFHAGNKYLYISSCLDTMSGYYETLLFTFCIRTTRRSLSFTKRKK